MGAVQLLKSSNNTTTTTASTSVPPPDYHQEASHFEEKLIQVWNTDLKNKFNKKKTPSINFVILLGCRNAR